MNYEDEWIDIIVWTTLPTLDLFRGHKEWADAFYLFFLYLRQSRIQDTKETFSLDYFMKDATWWGDHRFRKAKKLLKDFWMIRQLKRKNKKWKIIWHYVWVSHKYRVLSTTIVSQGMEKSSAWKIKVQNAPVDNNINAPVDKYKNSVLENKWISNAQNIESDELRALKEKNKMLEKKLKDLNVKVKYTVEFDAFWSSFPHARSWNKKLWFQNFKKSTIDVSEFKKSSRLLKMKHLSWMQDQSYLPACQRRIKEFVHREDVEYIFELKKLFAYIHENFDPNDDVYKKLKEDIWEKKVKELRKEWKKKQSKSFINSLKK